MTALLEKVLGFTSRYRMLDGARGVVVAVSGGPDSVALLDMLFRIRGQESLSLSLHVAHLDHQLRGEQSSEDARFVRELARELGLDFTLKSIDVRAEARSARRGIEETAREIRYRFLLDVARRNGCDRIATGHTMTDQAETFLMRLARGAGLRGLACMRPVTRAHEFGGESGSMGVWEYGSMGEMESERVEDRETDSPLHPPTPPLPHSHTSSPLHLLIRPLLCITREEVEEYCRARRLEFRTDATNRSLDYTRNRVRLLVMPAICEINPRAPEAIARAAEVIADEDSALARIACSLLDQSRVAKDAYAVAALIAAPAALRRRMMIEAVRRAGGAQIDSKHIESMERLLEENAGGKSLQLPRGVRVWREFDRIVFNLGEDEAAGYEHQISDEVGRVETEGLMISMMRHQPASALDSLMEQARREKRERGRDWMMVVLDDVKLPSTLVIRSRRRGERAYVGKSARIKKLKSLMIGHKIPASRRNRWPVVATTDGQYVWSPGLPPAGEFAPDEKARSLAVLRADEI